MLRSLRTQHGVPIAALRDALSFAEAELGIERLLLNRELCTAGGRMFLERYGDLFELSKSGQLTLRHAFEEHLKRVDWDDWQFPVRLHPFVASDVSAADRPISIDPKIAFGRPVITRAGVSTAAIADRVDADEDPVDVAESYGLSVEDIERAVLFERAA